MDVDVDVDADVGVVWFLLGEVAGSMEKSVSESQDCQPAGLPQAHTHTHTIHNI